MEDALGAVIDKGVIWVLFGVESAQPAERDKKSQ
jgi:hypothetical protein